LNLRFKHGRWLSFSVGSATATLGITSIDLQGIDNAKIIETIHARRAPMIPRVFVARRSD
jgi:hypothetical protein